DRSRDALSAAAGAATGGSTRAARVATDARLPPRCDTAGGLVGLQRLHDQRQAIEGPDDHFVPHVRTGLAAGLPELAAEPHLTRGPALRRDERTLSDQRLDPDHRSAALR